MKPEYEGMSDSQRAMHAARTARPGYSTAQLADASGASRKMISLARTVLKRSTVMADKVSAGELTVTAAYSRVKATRDPGAMPIDRGSISAEEIALALDPDGALHESDRVALAERLRLLYQDEAKLLREVADRLQETRERRQQLVHRGIDRIKSMSLAELERLVDDNHNDTTKEDT